jgi:hypothetical protein
MATFKSWRSYWNFERAIRREARYVRNAETEQFLTFVRETGHKRAELLPGATLLWRAQSGNDWQPLHEDGTYIDDIPCPHPPERMKPWSDRAKEGRVNPVGIPCLYMATDRDTALAEVRPWIGEEISVAQFRTLRNLKLLNCAEDDHASYIYFKEPSEDERERAVWGHINNAFARPVSRSDDVADYAPTQVIAELFKLGGFDGITYRSSLGQGRNIAIFSLDVAELINCSLFQLKEIKFRFAESANPYFLKKHPQGG